MEASKINPYWTNSSLTHYRLISLPNFLSLMAIQPSPRAQLKQEMLPQNMVFKRSVQVQKKKENYMVKPCRFTISHKYFQLPILDQYFLKLLYQLSRLPLKVYFLLKYIWELLFTIIMESFCQHRQKQL